MGGDYYGGRDVVSTTSNTGFSAVAAEVIGLTKELHSSLDPKKWSEENLQSESRHPIVFALDVTGSMGDWSKIIYDKMPMFYGQILMQNYLSDPAISLCAIGDSHCDKVPLQVSEFGQGKGIDQLLSKLFLEGKGGGNKHESYDLAANFYSTQVDLVNAEIPFFFVTGDEGYWEEEKAEEINRVLGHGIKDAKINSKNLWKNLMKKFNVFHIKKPFKNISQDGVITKQWVDTLGEERILKITEAKACVDVMLGAIAITSGQRTLEEYISDMKNRGQSKERIAEVKKALNLYSAKIQKGIIHPIRNKVTIDSHSNTNNNLQHIQEKNSEIKLEVSCELRNKFQNEILKDLDEEGKKFHDHLIYLLKTKENEVPKEFICPLTQQIMIDPVMTEEGISYERKAIEIWFENNSISPSTNVALGSNILLPNFALKQLIKDYSDANK
jgi:hypothetical protein